MGLVPVPKIGTLQKTILKTIYKITPQGESATSANGKINAENIPLPDYVDRETWIAYCRMRKAKRAEIKTQDTIKRCLRDLEKLCGGILIWLGRFWINLSPTPTPDYLL